MEMEMSREWSQEERFLSKNAADDNFNYTYLFPSPASPPL